MTKVQRKSQFPTKSPKKNSSGSSSREQKTLTAQPLEKTTDNSATLQQRDFYKMRDKASEILKDSRTNICGKRLIGGYYVPVVKNEFGKKHYGNLMKCGSVWVCPVCNYRIGVVRRIEIESILQKAKSEGKQIYHLTLTIRHKEHERLEKLLKDMSYKFNSIKTKRAYKQLFKDIDYIRALETTHGVNGWHPHYHILLMSKELDKDRLSNFTHEWNKLTGSTEKNTPLRQCNDQEDIEEYISKFEIKQELTNSVNKQSQNYWGFLCDPLGNEELIKEYYQATKGMRSITFSKGLKEKEKPKTDIEIMELSDKAIQNLIEIQKPVYFDVVVKYQLYKTVIDNAENLEKIDTIFKPYNVQRIENRLIPVKAEVIPEQKPILSDPLENLQSSKWDRPRPPG